MSNVMHLDSIDFSLSHCSEYSSPISCDLLGNNIASAKEFHIDGETIQVLYGHGGLSGPSFDVQKLFIGVYEDMDINEYFFPPEIVSLFTRVHNLKTFRIKGVNAEKIYKWRYWECQNLTFVEQLEKVELDVFNGGNELEFAKFLLKHAQNLKEMIISHFASLPSHVSDRLNKFKVSCDQMASITSAKVEFDPTKPFVEDSEEV